MKSRNMLFVVGRSHDLSNRIGRHHASESRTLSDAHGRRGLAHPCCSSDDEQARRSCGQCLRRALRKTDGSGHGPNISHRHMRLLSEFTRVWAAFASDGLTDAPLKRLDFPEA